MSDGAIVGLVIGLFGLLFGLVGGSYGFTWLALAKLSDRLPCMQPHQGCEDE